MGKAPVPPKAAAPVPKDPAEANERPEALPEIKKVLSDYEMLAEMLEQNPEFASCW